MNEKFGHNSTTIPSVQFNLENNRASTARKSTSLTIAFDRATAADPNRRRPLERVKFSSETFVRPPQRSPIPTGSDREDQQTVSDRQLRHQPGNESIRCFITS
ncbi:hypothetical protein M3Y94_01298800 [Aphelenchoides besseyi]|nr:hypothetical protein M3Y94_01298800 [Aphelenchoides besseyi]